MGDYETQYEEYKMTILRSSYFAQKLREKRNNIMYAERDFIDKNGALEKIGGLSAAFGFCLSVCWMPDVWIWIRIILAVIGIVCFFIALRVGSEFKDASGRSNFRAFVYDSHIEERVQNDKDTEAKKIVQRFLSREIDREEFKKQYENLSRFDRFAENLKSDYSFMEAISKMVG